MISKMQGVSDRYDRVVRVLGIETVDVAVQQDIRNEKALEEKQRMEQMPKGSIHERLAWGIKKSEMENQQREYYGAAEPPVRCGESHLSGLTEPPQFVY